MYYWHRGVPLKKNSVSKNCVDKQRIMFWYSADEQTFLHLIQYQELC